MMVVKRMLCRFCGLNDCCSEQCLVEAKDVYLYGVLIEAVLHEF